jgi:hypothetical protein
MRCDVHPHMDAVGTCVYCGRGVCDDCKVRIYDKIHCKECVEAGRVRGNEPPPQMYQPVMVPYYYQMAPIIRMPPKPKGPVNAAPLRIGAFGGLFGAIGLFITGGTVMFSQALMVVSLTLFALGLMLLAVASYGIYWNFGCSWGLFGTIALPIMAVLVLVAWYYSNTSYSILSGGFMFTVIPILVISMVFVHLSTGHVRLHLPTNSKMYGLMNFARILNYLAGAGVAAFFVTSIFLFFIAGGILILDFWILMNVPLPEMPQQQQPQQPYNPAPVRPGF